MRVTPSRALVLLAALAAPLAAAGCGDDPIPILAPEEVTYAPELGVDLDRMTRLDNGVYIETLQVGFGSYAIDVADSVHMAYTLWLPNGTELQDGDFELRLDQLIPGFREGARGMTEDEIRLMVVPSELGYGANPREGSGIPPHSVLVFEAELLDVLKIAGES